MNHIGTIRTHICKRDSWINTSEMLNSLFMCIWVISVYVVFSMHSVWVHVSEPLNVLLLADGVSWLCSTGGLDREPSCLCHYVPSDEKGPHHDISSKIHHIHTLRRLLLPRGVSHYHNIEYKRLKEKTIFMKLIWLKKGRDKYIKSDYNKLRINSRQEELSRYWSEDEGGWRRSK